MNIAYRQEILAKSSFRVAIAQNIARKSLKRKPVFFNRRPQIAASENNIGGIPPTVFFQFLPLISSLNNSPRPQPAFFQRITI